MDKFCQSPCGSTHLTLVLFYPLAGIHKGFYPRSHFVAKTALFGIIGTLPREYGTFEVRHHGQMAAIGRGYAGNALGRTVGVGGIGVVGLTGYHVIT